MMNRSYLNSCQVSLFSRFANIPKVENGVSRLYEENRVAFNMFFETLCTGLMRLFLHRLILALTSPSKISFIPS